MLVKVEPAAVSAGHLFQSFVTFGFTNNAFANFKFHITSKKQILRFKASLPPFHLHLFTIENPGVNSCIYFVQIYFNYSRRGNQMFRSQFKVSWFHPNSPYCKCKRNVFNIFIFKSIKLISKSTMFIRNHSEAQVSTLLKNLLASTFPFSECNT